MKLRPPIMHDIVLLDDDSDLLDSLEEYIRVRSGKACLLLTSYAALVSVGPKALQCELAILDINLGAGQPSGIDACRWLRDANFRGRVVLLTGHGRAHPLVQEAHRVGETRVLQKPVDMDVLIRLVEG